MDSSKLECGYPALSMSTSDSVNWDLIIVGGGAAGLWAAATAASRGLKTLVLEKNRKSGVKILMSGGTRCNITHHCGPEEIVQAFGAQGRFLKPSVYNLTPQLVVERFMRLGVATKIESTGKVFPVSDRALDVRDALVAQLLKAGAHLATGVAVRDVRPSPQAPNQWLVASEQQVYSCRAVLLCTGGLSYPGCGTTGDGYAWAEAVGHTIVSPSPALVPLVSSAEWARQLSGLTLPDVEVRVAERNIKESGAMISAESGSRKTKDSRQISRGGFLWTHFGCSGPAPMNVSRFVAKQPHDLVVDLLPDVPVSHLADSFDPVRNGKRRVAAIVNEWLPRKLASELLSQAEIADSLGVAELPKTSRVKLLELIKQMKIPLEGTRGYAKAEVTAGGVSTAEVNPRTLESRIAAGLFLAGEILDIDGPIGGYNFQAAFATAHQAALSIPLR
jgi:predicted Rossmann fold flavoprotein